MKRLPLFAALFLTAAASAFSYDAVRLSENDENYIQPVYHSVQKGDQNISISIGLSIPLNFPDIESLFHEDEHQLSIGGMGTLGYHYFVNSCIALGFDVGFGFNVTIGSHIFNYVPMMFSFTYQPSWRNLEFPLSLNAGVAWESYNNHNYFPGLVLKPEAGVHYRINENWSLGLDASWMLLPQFCEWYDKGENYIGQFATLSLAARYYF